MNRLSTKVLIAAVASAMWAAATGSPALAAPHATLVAQTSAPSDFGTPPAGDVPLLFNDRHVYAKPDRLRGGRVLTALIRGTTILVPLRSVFEQMGASVAFNDTTKAVDVSKPGADVKVTLGKPEVVINGESRPLDVAPEIYRGDLLVPLRVISEGMGAYVAWLPAKHTVVVRYLPAPVPTAPPVATATPFALATTTPTPAPSPTPRPKRAASSERFVVGDYVISPSSYNELSAGQSSKPSFRVASAIEFPLLHLPWMIEGDFRSYRYERGGGGPATASGAQGVVYVPSLDGRDDDIDARFALKVADPRLYIGVGYEFRNTNFEGGSFPTQEHGVGIGVEKLPDLDQAFSLYGSVYYFPSLSTDGSQNLGDGSTGAVQYRYLKYNVGLTLDLGHSPLFLQGGYLGDQGNNKQNAPSDFSHQGPYAGLGIHF